MKLPGAGRKAARLAIMQVEVEQHGAAASGQGTGDVREEFPAERPRLFFTCCHPALPAEAQTALTLRRLAGLPAPGVARAFLVPEATMARRIVRAALELTSNERERAFLRKKLTEL